MKEENESINLINKKTMEEKKKLSSELRKELIDKVNTIMERSADGEITFLLDFNVSDLRALYMLLWGRYPNTYDYRCMWEATNMKIMKSALDYVEPFGTYTVDNKAMAPFYVGDRFILAFYGYGAYVLAESKEAFVHLTKLFIKKKRNTSKPQIYWATIAPNGMYNKKTLEIDKRRVNINTNYNDDLDYEKVKKFLNNKDAGLMIFHGKPGTGKTFFLRHIVTTFTKKQFIFLDGNMLRDIDSATFINFLEENSGSILILEDCETLLQKRTEFGNTLLTTLLNLTDGILGDGFHIKFICTFNANLTDIDEAAMRKGRLFYKYEFKELTKEKADALAEKLGVEKPGKAACLCDIYNTENNGKDDKSKKKIGFGQ